MSSNADNSPPAAHADAASFEQRLKDAARKKRLAREQQQAGGRTSARAADPSAAAAGAAPVLPPDHQSIKATHNSDQSSPASAPPPTQAAPEESRSTKITERLKCWSHPVFSRWFLRRTTSSPSGPGGRGDVTASPAGRTRHTVGQSAASANSSAERNKKNQTASFRLNRLLTQSLADTAMLPQQPQPLRAGRARHSHRATRSVYVKPAALSSGALSALGARRSTMDMSPTESGKESAGNYAKNLTAHQQQLVTARAPVPGFPKSTQHTAPRRDAAQVVKTVVETEEELEFARNVDGGYAWVILAVVFVINASTWGSARVYGQIFDKLARNDSRGRTRAAMPFTIMGAVENMAGPISGCLLALTGSWRVTVGSGSLLIVLAHLFAGLSEDSQLGQLLSMGLMCGLGMSFVSISFFQVNNAYFVRYRNTAFGVGLTGAAFGTLILSPLCQYFLDNFEGTRMCYLMLSLIMAPNVALALLLKPKRPIQVSGGRGGGSKDSLASSTSSSSLSSIDSDQDQRAQVKSISERCDQRRMRRRQRLDPAELGIWTSVKLVVRNPLFHLIWPTQLIFCWYNFVFGMIIVDFGKDRGLDDRSVAHLVPSWAFGQLVGRLVLSSLVDLKFLSYKTFTVICFFSIGITTYLLNIQKLPEPSELFVVRLQPSSQHYLIILGLVFVLSMFIALLYILLNGLVVNYVETSLQPLSLGVSSFTGSFFLLPRAYVIGYYRDTTGNYDEMLTMFTCVCMAAGLAWLCLPPVCKYLSDLSQHIRRRSSAMAARKSIESTRPYSAWQLDQQRQQQQLDQQQPQLDNIVRV